MYFWLYRYNPRVKKNTNERYRQLDFCNKNTQTLNVKGFFVCKFSVQFTKAVLPQLVTWVCSLRLCKTECRAIMLHYCGLIWINLLLTVKNPFKYLLRKFYFQNDGVKMKYMYICTNNTRNSYNLWSRNRLFLTKSKYNA